MLDSCPRERSSPRHAGDRSFFHVLVSWSLLTATRCVVLPTRRSKSQTGRRSILAFKRNPYVARSLLYVTNRFDCECRHCDSLRHYVDQAILRLDSLTLKSVELRNSHGNQRNRFSILDRRDAASGARCRRTYITGLRIASILDVSYLHPT